MRYEARPETFFPPASTRLLWRLRPWAEAKGAFGILAAELDKLCSSLELMLRGEKK